MIERWFRSFKYEEAYLTEWHNIKETRAAISSYIHNYNFERCHSAIGDVTPASVYYPAMLYEAAKGGGMIISDAGVIHTPIIMDISSL